jgi:tetratricopeptide (TPR) repeat protein
MAFWSANRSTLAIGLAVGIFIIAGIGYYFNEKAKEKRVSEFLRIAEKTETFIRAEENISKTPVTAVDRKTIQDINDLVAGVNAFGAGQYPKAYQYWSKLAVTYPQCGALMSMMGAANLRERNFSLAAQKFESALALKKSDRDGLLKAARDQLGLALALFQLSQFPQAQKNALLAFDTRKKLLGPANRETLSAAHILATTHMAVQDNQKAQGLLEDDLFTGLNNSFNPEDQLTIDGLTILALAYSMDGQEDKLNALEAMVAAAGRPAEPAQPTKEGAPDSPDSPNRQDVRPDVPPESGSPSSENPSDPPARAELDFTAAYDLWNNLRAHDPASPVLPELILAMIGRVNGGQPPGKPLEPGTGVLIDSQIYSNLCRELAGYYSQTQQLPQALEIFSNLSPWVPDSVLSEITVQEAQILNSLGRYQEAEELIRKTPDFLPKNPEPQKIALSINRAIILADAILKQGRIIEEAEIELVAVQTKLTQSLPRKELETYPELAKLYLRLAQLLEDLGRKKDSQNYIRLAERVLRNAEKTFPEKGAEIAFLKTKLPAGKPKPSGPAQGANLPEVKTLPSPEVLRYELAAYKILGDLSKFETKIQTVLAQIPPQDKQFPRYLSLWLRYLEDKEDFETLIAELDVLVQNPLGQSDEEKVRFILNALEYKAKLLTKSGQNPKAVYELILNTPALRAKMRPEQIDEMTSVSGSLGN